MPCLQFIQLSQVSLASGSAKYQDTVKALCDVRAGTLTSPR